jgi:hypothetical protein
MVSSALKRSSGNLVKSGSITKRPSEGYIYKLVKITLQGKFPKVIKTDVTVKSIITLEDAATGKPMTRTGKCTRIPSYWNNAVEPDSYSEFNFIDNLEGKQDIIFASDVMIGYKCKIITIGTKQPSYQFARA